MSETKKLHKVFWVWEFEKEERWLNEMAQEGWALKKASFCTYVFEKTEPGEYIIRVETLDNSPDFENFMEELGPNPLAAASAGATSAAPLNRAPLICFRIWIPVSLI